LSRTIRVDHVEEYKMPKKKKDGEQGSDNTQIIAKMPGKNHSITFNFDFVSQLQ
jgi:hypothetical protein